MDYYEIAVKGHLGDNWKEWFQQFDITIKSDGTSMLTGYIRDQAELHGILARIRDLGLVLTMVRKKD